MLILRRNLHLNQVRLEAARLAKLPGFEAKVPLPPHGQKGEFN
jgi:hypothetical protein